VTTASDSAHFAFGPFRLDPAGRELLRDGVRVPLTRKAFDTLLALVADAGRVVSKERLFERVWGDTIVGEATLTQNIYTLRKALKGNRDEPRIETLAGVGYRFVGDVTEIAAEVAPAQRRSAVASLAVLPFRPLGPEAAEAHLGMCLADALITRLSRLGRLVVRPSSAMFRYVQAEADPVTVGRELRVDAVLEGTLLGAQDRLRANVQLVDVRSGSPLWAEKFDVPFVDVFAAEDEISEQVVTTLFERGGDLLAGGRERGRTPSEEAHRAYVRGRFFWNKRTHDGLDKAIDCFRRALVLFPEYAEAWAGLADCWAVYPVYADVPQRETIPKAQDAARKALEMRDDIPDPHASLAYTRFLYDWDWTAAAEGFSHAIEIDPHYSTAHHWRAFLLSALASHEEAVAAAERSLDLDPLSLVINADLALVLHFAERHEEAVRQCHRTLELEPGFAYAHFVLGLASASAGRAADAVRACRTAADLSQRSSLTLAALGSALAAAGDTGSARSILAELGTRFPAPRAPHVRLALVHAGLNDREAALVALEQAVEDRSRFVPFLGVWPAFAMLGSEPRFERLLERIGLGAPRTTT
jgi:DNA-binding winged helix-turn-helix (wHTH) protein/Tfp pilus assembly protein PilF